VGRVVPYKKMDMVMRAFTQMPDKKLVVIGEGWGARHFSSMIKGHDNIEWHGYMNDVEMIRYIQEAKACIFAAKEDFGILCVEVQACGTPVLALDYGGYKETVISGQTGYFFNEQTEQSVINVVSLFESRPLTDFKTIRQNALRFSEERFADQFHNYVQNAMKDFYK
jgi:glycosyltransferase involved in cell wall biosynthesis